MFIIIIIWIHIRSHISTRNYIFKNVPLNILIHSVLCVSLTLHTITFFSFHPLRAYTNRRDLHNALRQNEQWNNEVRGRGFPAPGPGSRTATRGTSSTSAASSTASTVRPTTTSTTSTTSTPQPGAGPSALPPLLRCRGQQRLLQSDS